MHRPTLVRRTAEMVKYSDMTTRVFPLKCRHTNLGIECMLELQQNGTTKTLRNITFGMVLTRQQRTAGTLTRVLPVVTFRTLAVFRPVV